MRVHDRVHDGVHVYSPGQASAMIAVVVFAIVSIIAVGSFLLYVSWISLHAFLAKSDVRRATTRARSFFLTQLGAYTVSLLLSNFLLSIAFIIDVHWIRQMKVYSGTLCTSQGVLIQLSSTASAFFTAVIAVHAFNTLICHNKLSARWCGAVVVGGWVVSTVISLIPLLVRNGRLGPMYGLNGLSCGVSLPYATEAFLIRLIPDFFALLVSAVFYFLIYLVLHGILVVREGIKLILDPEVRRNTITTAEHCVDYHRFITAVIKSMTWYPIAFMFLSLTSIVVDLVRVSGMSVPFGLQVFSDVCIAMLGSANAIILLNTLRLLSPFLLKCPSSCDNGSDSDSFYAGNSSPVEAFSGTLAVDFPEVRIESGGPDFLAKFDMSVLDLTAMPLARTASPRSTRHNLLEKSPTVALSQSHIGKSFADHSKDLDSPLPSLSLQRPITPMSALDVAVDPHAHETGYQKLYAGLNVERPLPSLPAPPRRTRSPVSRQPSIVVNSPTNSLLATVGPSPLFTPEDVSLDPAVMPPVHSPSQRDSGTVTGPSVRRKMSVIGARPSMESMKSGHYHSPPFSPPSAFASLSAPGSRAPSIASSTSHRGLPSNPRAYKANWEHPMPQVNGDFLHLAKSEGGHTGGEFGAAAEKNLADVQRQSLHRHRTTSENHVRVDDMTVGKNARAPSISAVRPQSLGVPGLASRSKSMQVVRKGSSVGTLPAGYF